MKKKIKRWAVGTKYYAYDNNLDKVVYRELLAIEIAKSVVTFQLQDLSVRKLYSSKIACIDGQIREE